MDSWLILLEPIVCNCAKRNRQSSANKQYETYHCPEQHVRDNKLIAPLICHWFQFLAIYAYYANNQWSLFVVRNSSSCWRMPAFNSRISEHRNPPRRRRFLWLGYHHLFYILSCKRRPKQQSPCLVAVPSVPVVLSVSVFIIIKNPRGERDGSADKRMKRGKYCVGEDSLLSLLVDVGEECHHFSICHVLTRVPYIFTTTVASFLPCRSYMCQQDEEECLCCFSSSGKCVNHYICKKKWEVEVDIERNRLLQRTHKWMSFGEN